MKKSKFVVWGFMIAAALWALAGLRDTFAPGFFSMSGRAVTSSTIGLDFVLAAMCFILAVSFGSRRSKKSKQQ